ncbi:peptide deformylase, partial [Acinetobacter baumannii]
MVPHPHPALRHKAATVQVFGDELRKLVGIMFDKMYERGGCGLAAPQLGLPFRVFVINPTGDRSKKDREVAFVNPTVIPKVQRGR